MTKNSGGKNRKKKSFMRFIENNALQTEEKIVINIVTHPSKLFYIWILGILGIWLFLIPTIFAIIKTIEYKNKEYVITNKRVIAKYGKRKVYYEAINLDKIITFTKSEEDLVADLLVIPDNSDWTGDGVAFRIKNNTGESYIAIYINEKDSDRVVLETGATYYTYDLQGVKKSTTSGRGWGNYIKLESNFDGYIYIPYSSFAIKAGFASGNDVMNYANVFGMYFETSAFYDSYQNYTIGEIQVLNGDVVKTVLDNSKQTSASYKNHYIADYNGKYINLNFTGEILEPSKLPFEGTLNGGVDVTFKADTSDGLATMLVKPQTLDWSGDGFILRIKENSGIQSFIDLRINETDSDRAKIKLNAAFYLYDLDGNVTETTSGRSWNSYILLPANFDGYVYVPYSSLEFENGGGDNNLTFASVWGIYLGTSKQFDAYQNYSVGSIIIKNGDTYKTVLDPTNLDDTTYSSNYTKDIFGDFINIARHK